MLHESPKPVALAEFPVVIRLPVQWGDQDAFGHVNNTVAIRWFESARVAYLEQSGLGHMMSGEGIGPILAAITCNYRKQQNYPDFVLVGARVGRIGNSSLTMHHAVFSEAQQTLTSEGDSVIVVFNYESQKPIRVPDDVRAAISQLEGRPVG